MKYKKKLQSLALALKWWDSQSEAFKAEHKRPGSVKQRIIRI